MSFQNVLGSDGKIQAAYLPVSGGGGGVASLNGITGAVSLAGTGTVSVSQLGSTITVNGAGSSGVSSISPGTGVVITGPPATPTINTVISANEIVPYLGPDITATSALGVIATFPGTSQAVTPSQYWLISGTVSIASTANDATKTMGIGYKFNVAGLLGDIINVPESIAGVRQSFTAVIKAPPGNSSFNLFVSGGVGGTTGNVTAYLNMLTYTRIA